MIVRESSVGRETHAQKTLRSASSKEVVPAGDLLIGASRRDLNRIAGQAAHRRMFASGKR